MPEEALEVFARNLHADVVSRAVDGTFDDTGLTYPAFREVVFTQLVLEMLEEQGVVEESKVLHYEGKPLKRLVRVSGYSLATTDGEDDLCRLDLFATVFLDSQDLPTVALPTAREALDKAKRFLEEMLSGAFAHLDPSSEAYGLGSTIHELRHKLRRVRLILLTDGLLKNRDVSLEPVDGLDTVVDVWDVERLHRNQASASHPVEISIDVREELGGAGLPCLKVAAPGSDYESYLCVIPGGLLCGLYERYGQRLLELNVRSFLSIAGKVNKGIRQTIRENPSHFFPFNNGLSLTASAVTTERAPDQGLVITQIQGLQIVNGGQTTASIHRAFKVDRSDLSPIFVQAKLTVINTAGDDDRFFDLVRQISLFANSQNKVNMADLSANEPFHVELERLALKTWTPGEQSQWFYERARGSYQALKAKQATTPAQKKNFDRRYPSFQRFTKTDLAKALNAWAPKPHIASLGGEKSFVHFMQSLGVKTTDPKLSVDFFKNLVGLLILYRRTEKIVKEAGIPAYRANVVAYLVAYLSWRTNKKLDLIDVWNQQKVPDSVVDALRTWAKPLYDAILESAGTQNVTEWCKKAACWDHISRLALGSEKKLGKLTGDGFELVDTDGLQYVKLIMDIPQGDWQDIHGWSAMTTKLTYTEKGVIQTLAGYALSGWAKQPSAKQAAIAVKALAKK